MNILWASPLPPIRSGVSDYAMELLTELATVARVRVLEPPGWRRPADWPLAGLVELVPPISPPVGGESTLVHLGNNPHHTWVLERLTDPRPVIVLHDLVLHHLLVEWAAGGAPEGELARKLESAHGPPGAVLANARRFGIHGSRDPFLFPALAAFVNSHTAAVVVHSRWGEERIRRRFPDLACTRIGLAAADPGVVDRAASREAAGVAGGEIVLMHLGFLTPEKGLPDILAGLAAARRCGIQARLLLVGEGKGLQPILDVAAEVGLRDAVTATGWVDREQFLRMPAAADLGIVLRTPSAGETSAAVLRFLACGTPTAVVGLHQFLEWPEEAAPRITPGPTAAADVARVLAAAGDEGAWRCRRTAARAAYEAEHRPAEAAARLVEFLETLS